LLRRSYGMILATGPTGSGKTTTLYTSLNQINSPEKHIITIEDPVEYNLPLIRQSQVNPKAGVTFATGLRAIIRQDPDIIMVGEIRDSETASIAIHAALTGHLVFSTLHTNDAPSACTRLIDMGIEPFLISSSIIGVLAQRLVRVLCSSCKEERAGVETMVKYFPDQKLPEGAALYSAVGCDECHHIGYRGRTALFELMMMTESIRSKIMQRVSASELKALSRKEGMKTIFDDGIDKVLRGVTTLEEVMRVSTED
ncbi:MAG: type II/IV secretion system protein, partial [Deltaproteobacteria bacterium]|nr:type II/IV secretion system protein [Deltaproteobacteria bacterium]